MQRFFGQLPKVSIRRLIVTGSLMAAAIGLVPLPAARASLISSVGAFKILVYQQTGDGNSLVLNNAGFISNMVTTVPNAYTSVTMNFPGPSSPLSLSVFSTTDFRYGSNAFFSKAAFDAAFPFGTYNFAAVNGGGTDTAGYNYTADDYAQSLPFLTGTDFSSLQSLDPTKAFTFHWNADVTGAIATSALLRFIVFDQTAQTSVFDTGLVAPTLTSATIGPNSFINGHLYSYSIDFQNIDTLTGFGSAASAPQLGFVEDTSALFTVGATPEPSTLGLLGLGLLAAFAMKVKSRRTATR